MVKEINMKAYTRNEIQRMATEKAIEILMENRDLVLNNVSCGWNSGNVLVSLASDEDIHRADRIIYIVLERGSSWIDGVAKLSVYEENYNYETNEKEMSKTATIRKFEQKYSDELNEMLFY